MSITLDRVGTFRCKLLEKGISKTQQKGYPQLVARVLLTELYDPKGGEDDTPCWFPIKDWEMETNVYQCLYGVKKGESDPTTTLGYDQVMKVFNWDGVSLAELNAMECDGLEFQVRSEENTHEGARSPFQINWIDEYDADPVYTLRKLDIEEIKDLDKQFSAITASAKKAASAPKKPASVGRPSAHPARVPADDGDKTPNVPKKPATPSKPKVTDNPVVMTEAEKKAKLKEKSKRIREQANQQLKAKANTATPPPLPDDDTLPIPEAKGSITKAEAWAAIFEMRDPSINDATIKELWDAAIEEVAGSGAKHADLTGENWYQVQDIVLKDCGKF